MIPQLPQRIIEAMSSIETCGWVYLIREREFLNSGEQVTKVGRTRDIIKRYKDYPKGSKLLFCMFCADRFETESVCIEMLSKNFKARKDIGSESFEGNTRSMIGAMSSLLSTRCCLGPELIVMPEHDGAATAGGAQPPRKPQQGDRLLVDVDIAIARFVDTLGPRNGMKTPSLELFGRFMNFLSSQKEWKTTSINHAKFARAIVHSYAATSEVVHEGGGTQRGNREQNSNCLAQCSSSHRLSTLTAPREDAMRCLKRERWVCCRLARDVRATAWGRHENAVLVCDLQSGVLLYHITR